VTLGLSLLHMIVALLVAWLRPDVFFVIFPFAFLALFTAWAAYHSHWRNNALRAQEEKLFKRVVRRIEAEQERRLIALRAQISSLAAATKPPVDGDVKTVASERALIASEIEAYFERLAQHMK